MKVTRLPHDGRMILGGKGSLTPFNLSQNNSPAAKQQSTAPHDPMMPAALSLEADLDKLAMDHVLVR
jgi:hypothetical protein